MSYVFTWFVRFALVLGACLPALAEEIKPLRGVALVIGQSDYQHLAKLNNTTNDARKIETLLNSLGFATDVATDRNAKKLRRDFEGFAEDATGADVALVYYSGHGIEAGGENFIIPIDADVKALNSADDQLVSLSGFLATLRTKAKITIVLLDACRSNPFPPGSVLTQTGANVAQQVSSGGLAIFRGAGADGSNDGDQTSQGEVIGFAAAPGQAALDGVPGANSPYATALLKHLASKGLDFGQVMTLVSQEVYLNTKGQQQPWTNTSLQQFLSFGQNPEIDSGDEALIRSERRKLLLTIAATPVELKKTVQAIAKSDGVPLDALFAMLKVLEVDANGDGAQLETQLKAGAAKLKTFMSERAVLKSADAEIIKYSKLADEAIAEGALNTATIFHEKAKLRVANLEANVGQAEADLRAKRLEFGAVFASSAKTLELGFRHKDAAIDWAKAFDQVAKWDRKLAYTYRFNEANAWASYGVKSGDNAALAFGIDRFKDTMALTSQTDEPREWWSVQNDMANAMHSLGLRETSNTRLTEALETYRAALSLRTREAAPVDWAVTQNNIGIVLQALGSRAGDPVLLQHAIDAYSASLEVRTREAFPAEWSMTKSNLGLGLFALGLRYPDTERLAEAVLTFRAVLDVRTQEAAPLDWAATQVALGDALQTIGEREAGTENLEKALVAYRYSLRERTREKVPLDWATTQASIANALVTLGVRSGNVGRVEEAARLYRAAIEESTRARHPLEWARLQNNLGNALYFQGWMTSSVAVYQEALAALTFSLEERNEKLVPLDWAATQHNIGNVYYGLGALDQDVTLLRKSAAAYRQAQTRRTKADVPLDWASTTVNLANTLQSLGYREKNTFMMRAAISEYKDANSVYTRTRIPLEWAKIQNNLGNVYNLMSELEPTSNWLPEAITSFRLALEETQRERVPFEWARTQSNLAYALSLLTVATPNPKLTEEARLHFDLALEVWTPQSSPNDWARVTANYGYALLLAAEPARDVEMAQRAAEMFRSVMRLRTKEQSLSSWALGQINLALTLKLIGDITKDVGVLRQAKFSFVEAQESYRALKQDYEQYFAGQIAGVDQAIAALE